MEFAGPASDVRVERVSRDCFKDGGAIAEVVAFYESKGNQDISELQTAVLSKEEKVDAGLEVTFVSKDLGVMDLCLYLGLAKFPVL